MLCEHIIIKFKSDSVHKTRHILIIALEKKTKKHYRIFDFDSWYLVDNVKSLKYNKLIMFVGIWYVKLDPSW